MAAYKGGSSLPASPETGQPFEFTASASGLSDARDTDGTTSITTASPDDVFVYDGDYWVKQADGYDITRISEDQALRALEGMTSGGIYIQYHDGDPGASGNSNVISDLDRTHWPTTNMTHAAS